jgi:hypothetical protein
MSTRFMKILWAVLICVLAFPASTYTQAESESHWDAYSTFVGATDNATISARRKRAASAFHDGILIVHAVPQLNGASDGYRQDPYFY